MREKENQKVNDLAQAMVVIKQLTRKKLKKDVLLPDNNIGQDLITIANLLLTYDEIQPKR